MSERTIERRMEFDASPERVWQAITDPAELSQWFGDDTRIDLRVGGDGAMIWDQHGSFAIRVEQIDPPRRFAWRWVHAPDTAFDDAPSTLVEWTVSPRPGGGSILTLRESGFRTDQHHQQNTEGWSEELGELQALLAA